MLQVVQFRYNADNFSYLIYGKEQAIAIDGGADRKIIDFLQSKSLTLTIITNTHGHFDHTSGNEKLRKLTKAQLLNVAKLFDNQEIIIDGERIFVYRTPGHTTDSVCFHTGNILVSGDTLFNGTIGNCFTGDLKSFYLSIIRLMVLPDETVVYAGHDYIRDSLAFASWLEPDNKYIAKFRNTYDHNHVCSTMADEHRINPYLRFNEKPIIAFLEKKGLPCATQWDRWKSLMSIE